VFDWCRSFFSRRGEEIFQPKRLPFVFSRENARLDFFEGIDGSFLATRTYSYPRPLSLSFGFPATAEQERPVFLFRWLRQKSMLRPQLSLLLSSFPLLSGHALRGDERTPFFLKGLREGDCWTRARRPPFASPLSRRSSRGGPEASSLIFLQDALGREGVPPFSGDRTLFSFLLWTSLGGEPIHLSFAKTRPGPLFLSSLQRTVPGTMASSYEQFPPSALSYVTS